MGCTGSKLVAAEPLPSQNVDIPKENVSTPQARPRQARLSLAGSYDQFEKSNKFQIQNNHSGNGFVEPTRCQDPALIYAYISQKGHYPDQPFKANQDAVVVIEDFAGKSSSTLMVVMDGHGETGAQCAHFTRTTFPSLLESSSHLASDPSRALHDAMIQMNNDLHRSHIDDTLSGTTACAALIQGTTLHIANVGDSRAVVGVKRPGSDKIMAVDLSSDQTPFREDECCRVKHAGARVLTLDQIEGIKDAAAPCWTNEEDCDGDPPRLWASEGTYPGTAFTRSIGDSVAETIGVIADPEITATELTPDHQFFIVASDGIWEFLSSQHVVDIVAGCSSSEEAAQSLVSIAYKAWLQKEMRTDDISVVVAFLDFQSDSGTLLPMSP